MFSLCTSCCGCDDHVVVWQQQDGRAEASSSQIQAGGTEGNHSYLPYTHCLRQFCAHRLVTDLKGTVLRENGEQKGTTATCLTLTACANFVLIG
jgi:surfactin synthase thioesterase subunit